MKEAFLLHVHKVQSLEVASIIENLSQTCQCCSGRFISMNPIQSTVQRSRLHIRVPQKRALSYAKHVLGGDEST